jgi:hypothetical protein
MARPTYEQITTDLTTDEGLSAINMVYFHYFNPNGLYKVSKDVADAVWDLYMEGKVTSGAAWLYNMSWAHKEISALCQKARVSPTDIRVWKRMVESDIAKARKFIAEIEAGKPVTGAAGSNFSDAHARPLGEILKGEL